jgi:hypothetical protein
LTGPGEQQENLVTHDSEVLNKYEKAAIKEAVSGTQIHKLKFAIRDTLQAPRGAAFIASTCAMAGVPASKAAGAMKLIIARVTKERNAIDAKCKKHYLTLKGRE